MINRNKWKWYGFPGHFVCASRCRFHLCTRVGKFLVSTVGAYARVPGDPFEPLASGPELYETKVSKHGKPLDCARYMTAMQAEKGHMAMCVKYAKRGGHRR